MQANVLLRTAPYIVNSYLDVTTWHMHTVLDRIVIGQDVKETDCGQSP